MGEGAVQSNPASDGHHGLRAAIADAARSLAARIGIEDLTLGKVAKEAGLRRSEVYGQFARKEELLMTIVSEDLAALARGMRGIDWQSKDDEPKGAAAAPAEVIELARDVSAVLASTMETIGAAAADEPEATAQTERKLARRAELVRVLDGGAAGAAAEKPAPGQPDAWLERRLRTFERGMTAVEARQEQVEKISRTAIATAQDAVATMEATIKELKERADAAEARQKATTNELRTALNEAQLRMQTVESVARAALAENGGKPAAMDAEQAFVDFVPTPVAVPAANEDVPATDAPDSFLAKARKTAIAAHAAAQQPAADKSKKKHANLSRYLLGALIVLVVFIAAAELAFSQGVRDGRHEAMLHIVRVAPAHGVTAARHQTPLDALTARARGGDSRAELQVGARYFYGDGTAKDSVAALKWLTLAAVHGQPVAQYLLGTMYQRGLGTTADAVKALQWYEAAALQGNRKAMHDLAIAYAQGLGTVRNLSEAARWFSRAAGFGYVDSQFNLAVLYERGDGVPQSLLDAYKWYALASRQGDAEAKQRIEALRTQLGAEDLAAAQHAAAAFRALPYNKSANAPPA